MVMMELTKILVTGGCGFVGGRVVKHLLDKYPDCHVTVLDCVEPCKQDVDPTVEYAKVDITSLDEVISFFKSNQASTAACFQAVIHVAGISPPLAERYARRMDEVVFRVNTEGTRNMVQAAQKYGVRAFVYTSSICAVTDDFSQSYANIDERWPLVERGKASSYGESKAASERIVLPADCPQFRTCALRPAVIFGEGDRQLVPNIVNCITHKNESPFQLGDGTNMWDVVYVGNVADAHVLAVENLLSGSPSVAGEAIFIANEEPVSCRDLMLQIWKEYNGHIPPFQVRVPLRLAWAIGYFCEFYTWVTGSPTTLSRGSVMDAVAMRYVNGTKANRLLGYRPRVSMADGLRRSCQWLRNEHAQQLKLQKS